MAGSTAHRQLLEAIGVFGLFRALAFASRYVPAAQHAMAGFGPLLPRAWGARTGGGRRWGSRARPSRPPSVGASRPERSLTPDAGGQLAVGVPIWLLLTSPFQEYFFRGWLQPV